LRGSVKLNVGQKKEQGPTLLLEISFQPFGLRQLAATGRRGDPRLFG
jgi:hypothetical protein